MRKILKTIASSWVWTNVVLSKPHYECGAIDHSAMDALILKTKKNMLKQISFFDLFVLFCAFIYGNLFAIQYSRLNWNILLIFCIVLFLEFLNKTLYFFRKKEVAGYLIKEKFQSILPQFKEKKKIPSYPYILTNTLKRGLLLGFFVEAFKVGS